MINSHDIEDMRPDEPEKAAAAANCTYPHCQRATAVGCQGICKTYLTAPQPKESR